MCGQSLRLPVAVRLVTDDGVLNEQLSLGLATECGSQLTFSHLEPPSVFEGNLAQATEQLGEAAEVELSGGFYGNRIWFDIYVTSEDSPFWLLTGKTVYWGEPVHDVSRGVAGITEGKVLGENRCTFPG